MSGTHRCPVDACEIRDVPDHLLMCGRHWGMVPPALQRDVYRAYQRGAGIGTTRLLAAQRAAVSAVNRICAQTGPQAAGDTTTPPGPPRGPDWSGTDG